MTDSSQSHKMNIGIFTASTQGLYFGELINQIRQLCFIKGYSLTIINTGKHGEFNADIGIERLDAIITLKNSISNALAERIYDQYSLPCVSIGYDYFPTAIPVVSTDNEWGIRLAFETLLKNEHERIAFIGDLSQYDIRKRYEAYCDLHEEYNLPLNNEYLFNVDNARFSGGIQAAKDFNDRASDATAVIAGSGLTGIGFIQQLTLTAQLTADELEIICFDAISLAPVFTPKMSAIDANLHLIAYRAINLIEDQAKGIEVNSKEKIQPKLIKINTNPEDSYNEFIATCVDLPEFHNANYMKGVIANLHEWTNEIVDSDLEKILSIEPIFKKFINAAVLTQFHTDSKNNQWIKIVKIITPTETLHFQQKDKSAYYKAATFGLTSIAQHIPCDFDLICHYRIEGSDSPWGFITTLGKSSTQTPASSFFAFSAYIKTITTLYASKIRAQQSNTNKSDKKHEGNIEIDPEATVSWDYANNITTWSPHALNKLGFESKIEINIYQHMEITDRLRPNSTDEILKNIAILLDTKEPFTIAVQIKTKKGMYLTGNIMGEIIPDEENQHSLVEFSFGLPENTPLS